MSVPNYLSAVEFKLVIDRLPNVEFFVQRANVPGIASGFTTTQTPFKDIHGPGDKLDFDDFVVDIVVDENMSSYLEAWNWLVALTKPNGFDGYAQVANSDEGIYSDGTLFIMNNSKNSNIKIKFKDLFPVSVGQIDLDTTAGDIEPPTATLTFKYLSFDVEIMS